jgi:HlyD family secretion protein
MNKRKQLYRNSGIFQIQAKVIFYLLLILIPISCSKGKPEDFTVMTGSFRQSIIETGELDATKASFIMMPRIGWQYGFQFKIIGLEEHGKTVHKGDSVIKLDASSIYKFIIEREDMLENEQAAATKQMVESENNIQELNAQLKNEQAAYDLKKLEVERSKFDTDVKKRIKELEFQQATIRLNKVKRNLELKPILNNYDRIIQRIHVIQRETELSNAKKTLEQFLIRSPLDGIFQVAKDMYSDNPQTWRLGDSPYQGQIIASIPDITKMEVKTYINEADISKVRPGMKVIVRLDALPSVPFNGIITDISRICLIREREKVFNIIVEITESDQRLKPGMTVSCEYILYEADKDLFVPNSCLVKEAGHSYIFLKKGGSSRKVEVQSGIANTNYTIIKGDIKPGQKLVPFDKVLNSKKL